LRRYETLAGTGPDAMADRLLSAGLRWGVDRQSGRVVDELAEDGTTRSASSRLWPHTEALKILAVEQRRGHDHADLIGALVRRLSRLYCRPELGGGWIDQLDAGDRPVSAAIPASSLYHLMLALAELTRATGMRDAGAAAGLQNQAVGLP
jgi:mannose-6-phosphate isomerase